MNSWRTFSSSALLVAVLLSGGCDFPPNLLACVDPQPLTVPAGSSVELANPCGSPQPNAPWVLGDSFEIGPLGTFPPGIQVPGDVDVTVNALGLLPTRKLRVAAGLAPQTLHLLFVYKYDSFSESRGTTHYLGNGHITLNITAPGGLTVHATADPSTVNSGGQAQLDVQVQGGVGPFSYEWSTPDGSVISTERSPSVTPAAPTNYTVKVTDASNITAQDSAMVTVRPPLTIMTPSLPSGVVGVQYGQQLSASDTSGHLDWTVTGGMRPDGLDLGETGTGAGYLSGTPRSAGTFNFTVHVLDTDFGRNATHDYSVQIDNPVPSLDSLNPSTAAAGTSVLPLTINGSGFVAGATVTFGSSGPIQPSSTPSLTQIAVNVPASSLATAGPVDVVVINPGPGGGHSPSLTFEITAPVIAGLLQSIDVDPNGTRFGVTIGRSGRFVSVMSQPSALSTTTQSNVFLHDTCIGAANCSPSTVLASAIDGTDPPQEGDGGVLSVYLSGDGNTVGFDSAATNLVSTPSTPNNAFLRYTCADGSSTCVRGTALASVTNAFGSEPNYPSRMRAMASEGRYFAFWSNASDILESPNTPSPAGEVYLRDTCIDGVDGKVQRPGCSARSIQVSRGSAVTTTSVNQAALSQGGRFVVFVSDSQTDEAGQPLPPFPLGRPQVFLRDTCGDPNNHVAGCTSTLAMFTVPEDPYSSKDGLSISADGRIVVFTGDDFNIPGASLSQVFVQDTCRSTAVAGLVANCDPNAPPVPVPNPLGPDPSGNAPYMSSSTHSISDDGRYVLFVAGYLTGLANEGVYVRDTCWSVAGPIPGCAPSTKLVSLDDQQNVLGDYPLARVVRGMAISGDGHYAVFLYLVPNAYDANGIRLQRVGLAATGF